MQAAWAAINARPLNRAAFFMPCSPSHALANRLYFSQVVNVPKWVCVISRMQMQRPPAVNLETCALCRQSDDFRQSHIVPRFVYDWLKSSSATGYFRTNTTPNRREQDGQKLRLLCGECEQRLAAWEKLTAEQAFLPLHEANATVMGYGQWFGAFCTSLTWRILFAQRLWGGLDGYPEALLDSIHGALECWRAYLLGERGDVGPFEHHVIPLEPIASSMVPGTPANMNRYFMRSVDTDIPFRGDRGFVYAKLCRLLIVGFIRPEGTWAGTRIDYRNGELSPRQYEVPGYLGGYMMGRAEEVQQIQNDISERQRAKGDAFIAAKPDKVAKSESFRAMIEDVRLSGKAAFRKEKP